MSETVAAIDCGTHSTRVLIRKGDETLEREVELTKLGAGLRPGGALQPEACDRVYEAVTRYRTLMDRHDVARVRIAATSAARDASNGPQFLDRVAEIVGVVPELLTGEEEGELTFAGAATDLVGVAGPLLVVDIGGGSTELAFGTTTCEAAMSLDIGSVRVTEQYLDHDPPLPEELSACISVVGLWLDDVDREMPQAHDATTVIGVAGTVSTAVAVELGLPAYDRDQIHHFELTREAAEDVFRTLATEAMVDRAHNPGLPPGRVATIVGGMSILVKVMRHFDLDSIIASESDLLDGLARSLQ